ncbi:serine hydrolase domain-containing protein [Bacillus pacificus]
MKVRTTLQRYMSSLSEASYFNGTVLIAKNDEILLSEAFGTANFTFNIPHTIDTKFRIGSLTKGFTSTAILQLEERGLLSVEDSNFKIYRGILLWRRCYNSPPINSHIGYFKFYKLA